MDGFESLDGRERTYVLVKSMETLMRMQNSFDIAEAHKREGAIKVACYVPKPAAEQQQPKLP